MGDANNSDARRQSEDFSRLAHNFELSPLSEEQKRTLMGIWPKANPDEVAILGGVLSIPSARKHVMDILSGAHVRIFDFGSRYEHWKGLKSAHTRRSSHASDGPQYHVDGPLSHTILFGKIGNRTWMQLEGNPQGVGHVVDWIKYSVTKKNQGPYGSSSYVENRPLEFIPPQPKVVEYRQVFR